MEIRELVKSTKFIVEIGDLHAGIGNNSREELLEVVSLFEDFIIPEIKKLIVQYKLSKNSILVVFFGDIHDSKQLIATMTINVIMRLMDDLSEYVNIIIIDGNHDLPTQNPNINTNRYLQRNNIQVISEPTLINIHDKLIALIPHMPELEFKEVIKHAQKLGVNKIFGHN
jgi:metallophosphoesterase superfamily enzyme